VPLAIPPTMPAAVNAAINRMRSPPVAPILSRIHTLVRRRRARRPERSPRRRRGPGAPAANARPPGGFPSSVCPDRAPPRPTRTPGRPERSSPDGDTAATRGGHPRARLRSRTTLSPVPAPGSLPVLHGRSRTPRLAGRTDGPPGPGRALPARRHRVRGARGGRRVPHGSPPLAPPGVLGGVRGAARLPGGRRPALHRLADVRTLGPLLREAVRGGDEPPRLPARGRERVDGVELRPGLPADEALVRQAPRRLPGHDPPASGRRGRPGGLPRPGGGARPPARRTTAVARARPDAPRPGRRGRHLGRGRAARPRDPPPLAA